jgi:hypothetical protein
VGIVRKTERWESQLPSRIKVPVTRRCEPVRS